MRLRDWRNRLATLISACARTPARPGQFDCVLLVVGARLAITGEDILAPHEGAVYATYEEGFELLRAAGFEDHIAWATQGLTEIPPAFARAGDIAELDGNDGIAALGIVQGENVYVLHPGARGIGLVPLTEVRRAWRL